MVMDAGVVGSGMAPPTAASAHLITDLLPLLFVGRLQLFPSVTVFNCLFGLPFFFRLKHQQTCAGVTVPGVLLVCPTPVPKTTHPLYMNLRMN